MRYAILAMQWLVRLCAVVQVVLGALFWTGNAYTLLQLHMVTGVVLVLGLWVLAALAARAGVGLGMAALAFVWGLVVVGLGMTQDTILTGELHWLIKVVHLLVGLAAVGLAETLAQRAQHAPAQTLVADTR